MEIVEIISLICAVVILIMLAVMLVKGRSNDSDRSEQETAALRREIELLGRQFESQNKLLVELQNGLHQTVSANFSAFGDMLRSSQEQQQKQTNERLEKLEKDFNDIRTSITASLEKIQTSNTESIEKLRKDNQQSLEKINDTVNEKLQKTLNERLTQSFSAVNERLEQVHRGLGEMKSVASGVSDLKNVLSNVKTRGTLGEIQLGAILEEILAPEQFCAQQSVKPNSSEKVDFAVKLPGAQPDERVYLPIDSKFPQDRFSDLLAAYESGDTELIKQKRGLLDAEIKRCAKSISEKYIAPPYTTDFAIMFLPFEGLYAEVINMGLVEVLQKNYKVNIAGPSTMAAMLNSLQMGFRTLAIQQKSGEVWKILQAAKIEFNRFGDVLAAAKNRLRQADDELEKLIGVRSRAISRSLKTVELLDSSEDSAALLGLDQQSEIEE